MKKVFLSYSRQDETFVEELYRRLSRDGVSCFRDKESIAGGANLVNALEKGLDESGIIVCVLSPAYCQSKWTHLERSSVLADDPEGIERQFYPLLLEPCYDLLPRFLKAIKYRDVSSEAKFEALYPTICRELGGNPVEVNYSVDRNVLPPVCPLPDCHYMPYRSLGHGFVGRVEALWQVHDMLRESQTAVVEGVGIVMGIGGLGKTQLAIEYVHRFGQRYPGGVFWIEADQGRSRLIQQLARYAQIEIDSRQPEDDQLAWLWNALSRRRQPALIVLDNFPEHGDLRPYLPPSGQIAALVTTRRRDLNYARLPLPFLNVVEGVQLLNAGTRRFTLDEAAPLVEMLGGLALALELTRHFLNLRPTLTIEALQQEIRRVGEMRALEQFAQKYGDELPSRHIKEISATFQLSWDMASPMAQKALTVMAGLAPAPVPRRLLKAIFQAPSKQSRWSRFVKAFKKHPDSGILEDQIDAALSELAQGLSLVELDQEQDPQMHRLIAGFVREASAAPELFARTAAVVAAEMGRVRDDEDVAAFRQLEKISPHAEALASGPAAAEQKIDLLNDLGWHQQNWGRYRQAATFGRQALALAQQSLSEGHETIATQQSNLAAVLKGLGELDEARDLLRAALQAAEAHFAPGHPTLATHQSNLALVLRDLGEMDEARDLLRAALQADEAHFAPGHPTIATDQSNLATVLRELGEMDEARDLLRAALQSAEAHFAPGHPAITIRQSNLALVLQDLGELTEARDLLRAALQADEARFAPGHPAIATAQSNLALVLRDLGELDEARELVWQAYQTCLQKLGPRHPHTQTTKKNWEVIQQQLAERGRA